MLHFHVSITGALQPDSLGVSFDESLAALSLLPRLFIEPDGSFVWRGVAEDGGQWQVDGNLIDRGDVLAYVELKGACPEEQFNQLLAALGWPGETLAFQLPRVGIVLAETEFRARAATPEGAG
jgi:hypothetical protein